MMGEMLRIELEMLRNELEMLVPTLEACIWKVTLTLSSTKFAALKNQAGGVC
jgi:hypothetical protein